MNLTSEEREMLAGGQGEAVRWAMHFQLQVGQFFGAQRMVPVGTAHAAAEMALIGDAGLELCETLAAQGGKVRVPCTTDPCSVDFDRWERFGQPPEHVSKERRLIRAFEQMGMMPTLTCVNYQTVSPPRFGEHVAWGDTGAVAFANSAIGARSNFEGGPAAIAAALIGRVPEYGYHLSEQRRGTFLVEVRDTLRESADWGALGCWIGRQVMDYWEVPVIVGDHPSPSADDLKHLGASLASYGSYAMFHLVGSTPEARTVEEATGGKPPAKRLVLEAGELSAVYESFRAERPEIDLVVFTAPQLSLYEVKTIADGLAGRRVHPNTQLFLTVDPQVKAEAQRLGYDAMIRDAGGEILAGVCFYVMTPDLLRERYGYRTIMTTSAKLANIIEGYGYQPLLRRMEACLESAVTGRL